MVPLERLFDNNDLYLKYDKKVDMDNIVDCNIGTEGDPKMVKISKSLLEEERERYVQVLKEFSDVFAWSYEDLITYDTCIMQQKNPLNPNTKLVKQNLGHLKLVLLPIIEIEIKKLWNYKIITPLIFSNWVANIVSVRKKNGKFYICVDSRNLNKCSLKENYPLSKRDYILKKVVGSKRIYIIDGFFGYNQIVVHENDQQKTSFTTPWGCLSIL